MEVGCKLVCRAGKIVGRLKKQGQYEICNEMYQTGQLMWAAIKIS